MLQPSRAALGLAESKGEALGNLVKVYTSLEGRIGRKTWWLAAIALVVVILIIEFSTGVFPNTAALLTSTDPAAASATLADAVHKAQWISLIVFLIFGFPFVALGVKRRHDKDNSGLDVMIFYGIALVLNLVEALGIGFTTMGLGNGVMVPTPSLPLAILGGLLGIYGIYMLVVLGFLKGTTGSNQYGPDPLVAGVAASA